MRILHIVHQYPPHHVGGTELYTQTLAHYQARESGHSVAVYYPSPDAPAPERLSICEDERGVRVYAAHLGSRSRGRVFVDTLHRPELVQALEAVLNEFRPDIVHIQHLMGLPASVGDLLHDRRTPFVITLHDYWFPCANGQLLTNYDNTFCQGPYYWINCGRCAVARAGLGDHAILGATLAPLLAYRSRLLQRVLARAECVIAPTNFVRDMYVRLGMPADRMVVVPHGIQVPPHVGPLASSRQPPASRLEGQPLHIVYVGSLAWQKGVHVLVEAVNRLPHGAVRLSIYGDLDKFPDYVAQLQTMATHPDIHFGGRIGREDFWRLLLEDADVAVLPTLWYEASPLTIQEMFAACVPIVASRIGALPEKIRHGVDGLLFPPGDPAALRDMLTHLLNEPQLLHSLRTNIQPTRLMEEHVRDIGKLYSEVTTKMASR